MNPAHRTQRGPPGNGERTGLQNPQLPGAIERPFDILRRLEVPFDPKRPVRQRGKLARLEHRALRQLRRDSARHHTPGRVQDPLHALARDALAHHLVPPIARDDEQVARVGPGGRIEAETQPALIQIVRLRGLAGSRV